MNIVSAAEMREIDRITTGRYSVPSLTLMENAGSAVARFVVRWYPDARRITVVCGKGNNGGDGFVAARKLHEANRDVRVVLLASAEEVKGDARANLERLPVTPVLLNSKSGFPNLEDRLSTSDLVLDAIFGTGFRPPLPETATNAIDLLRRTSCPVISVDIPSGADSDSFALDQPQACRSDAIVTFTAPKPAIIFSALTRGPIVVADIGSPKEAVASQLGMEWNRPAALFEERRRLNSNKGLYGHALIIGGSRGKSGAPTMASMAALRMGAGLVTCAIPKGIQPIVAASIPELMTEALDENAAGALSNSALNEEQTKLLLERKSVVALGPGLGQSADTKQSVQEFVTQCPLPLVLDADGLNAFAGKSDLLDGSTRPLVLTPHPGEMARLIGKSVAEIERDRVHIAREFARKHHLILVLKGWRTLTAEADGQVFVNTSGNPGLAKGGSGDVLTGMIAGMIAQHPKQLLDSVRAAVYLHGLAADCALRRQTEQTMLATDVISAFPEAFRTVSAKDEFTWIQRGAERS
jgi:ADP-dependent NAD(P)H-hydrate dehydratase / NAD(P)H-hydrate epimerase